MLDTIGGLGLFLLGLSVLTDGLRALAGRTLKQALVRFTKSPFTGVLTGTAITSIIQSSSATTVAVIGFVGAGLLSFPAALGVIYGANIGTTMTGWLVVLLGFKLKLGTIVLPLVFVGALMRLFGNDVIARIGTCLAGFSLIFVGLDLMQQGMAGLQTIVDFSGYHTDSTADLFELITMGILFSAITQSSSAGVAATLSALFTGTIQLEQGIALVIGMNIGTTITTLIASIGGSCESRRTALSHLLYNLITAAVAIFLINPYLSLWETLFPGQTEVDTEIVLITFHTFFNILGVLIILPFNTAFANAVIKLVPEKPLTLTSNLDRSLLKQPAVALISVRATLRNELNALLHYIIHMLEFKKPRSHDLIEIKRALDATLQYVEKLHLQDRESKDWKSMISAIHSLDHLNRLYSRCKEQERANNAKNTRILNPLTNELVTAINEALDLLDKSLWQEVAEICAKSSKLISDQVEPIRITIMSDVVTGELDIETANFQLEAIRWLDRTGEHLEKITYHLSNMQL